jgi:hypothetical protein
MSVTESAEQIAQELASDRGYELSINVYEEDATNNVVVVFSDVHIGPEKGKHKDGVAVSIEKSDFEEGYFRSMCDDAISAIDDDRDDHGLD